MRRLPRDEAAVSSEEQGTLLGLTPMSEGKMICMYHKYQRFHENMWVATLET